jgi:hypothetical protein
MFPRWHTLPESPRDLGGAGGRRGPPREILGDRQEPCGAIPGPGRRIIEPRHSGLAKSLLAVLALLRYASAESSAYDERRKARGILVGRKSVMTIGTSAEPVRGSEPREHLEYRTQNELSPG